MKNKNAIIETTKPESKAKEAKETKEKKGNKPPEVKYFDDGLWKVKFNEAQNSFEKVKRLCKPLKILAMTRTEDSNNWGVLLEWKDPDNNLKTWVMPCDMLSRPGSEWVSTLQAGGLSLTPEGVPYIKEYLANAEDWTTNRVKLVTKTGWSDDKKNFALPHMNIGAEGSEKVVMQQTPGTAKMYKSSGTLEEWKTEVAAKSVGNSRLSFMLCAALTGPMLFLTGGENGGFHIVGESSKGKSTALRMAASIYGDQAGHFKSWRTTDNAAESLAIFSNDGCLILDEIGEAPARACGDMAYMLANGLGKARANRDGQARAVSQWRTTFLSSGEITLTQKLSEVEKKAQAGQSVRVVEFLADAGAGTGVFEDCHGMRPSDFAIKIKEVSSKFYGTAGPAFIEALIKKGEIANEINNICADFSNKYCEKEADGQVIRVARKFGLCFAAGMIAVESGILPHTVQDIENAVKKCFDSWLELRGGQGAGEDATILKTMKLFIELHGQSRFQSLTPRTDADGNIIEQVCYGRCGFRDDSTYYVLPGAWDNEIFKGLNAKKAAKILRKEEILRCKEFDHYKTKVTLPGLGKTACYIIKMDTSDIKLDMPEQQKPLEIQAHLLEGMPEETKGVPTEEFYREIISGMQ